MFDYPMDTQPASSGWSGGRIGGTQVASAPGGRGGLFVRQSTGLVREASALDATIFNAVFSAPVGATLAFGIFWALSAFPKADFVAVTLICAVINIPVLVMMSLLASSMPRTGGDYVWVSRIISPPVALVSNFGAALSAMIGATFWARYFAVLALGPVLTSLGAMLGIQALTDWGTAFQTDKVWTFLGGFSMIALMTVILVAGTKTTFRFQNIFWIIASVGTFVAFVCLAFGSPDQFRQNFDALNTAQGGGTMADVIAKAGVAGIQPELGNMDMTLPAIFVVMTFMMWNWWSVYLSGELKSAMNRSRQMTIMVGALVWDVLFIALGAALLFKVTGFDFVVAANTADSGYAIPGGAFYQVLAALVYNVPALTILIVGSFLFWSLPAMVGNTFMPIRTVFAWSFDRLLPERLSSVSDRTHSPVPAILVVMGIVTAMLAWSIWSTDFNTWLALGVLAGVVCVVIVAVAAMLFPTRRADLYQASPANVKLGGIPVLYIVSPLAILAMVFLTWCVVTYPPLAIGSPDNLWWVPSFIAMIVIVGLVVYFGAKVIRRGQGIDIDLVYKELPPE